MFQRHSRQIWLGCPCALLLTVLATPAALAINTAAAGKPAVPAVQLVAGEDTSLHPAEGAEPAPGKPQLSAEGAAHLAREEYGGRVLAVHWTGYRYRIKLLRRGEIRIVEIEGD